MVPLWSHCTALLTDILFLDYKENCYLVLETHILSGPGPRLQFSRIDFFFIHLEIRFDAGGLQTEVITDTLPRTEGPGGLEAEDEREEREERLHPVPVSSYWSSLVLVARLSVSRLTVLSTMSLHRLIVTALHTARLPVSLPARHGGTVRNMTGHVGD